MKALEFIKLKQKAWAERKGFTLIPGTIANEDGDKIYLDDYNKNLYESLSEDNEKSYNEGSGGETKDSEIQLAPMKAVFSSSAIVVNLFQYWQEKKDITPLLKALGFEFKREIEEEKEKIIFESKNQITGMRGFPPHLDVIITTNANNFAIESKFTEPYTEKRDKYSKERGKNSEIRHSYIADRKKTLWENLPNLKQLAQAIYNQNYKIENEAIKELIEKLKKTKHLDASQLIKHILGLKSNYGENFTLLYLWYNVPGTEAEEHQKEIDAFAKIVEADGIKFAHTTYQDVIKNLDQKEYKNNPEFKKYIDYLKDRYDQPIK